MLGQLDLGDVAAIVGVGVTFLGVLAAFTQISILQRENKKARAEQLQDRKAQQLIAERQEELTVLMKAFEKAYAESGFAIPVLTTIIQLQALCLYVKQIMERDGVPAGRYALTSLKSVVEAYLCEFKAYETILNVLLNDFGSSAAVTSILMRAQKDYFVLISDISRTAQHEDIQVTHESLRGRLNRSSNNFHALVLEMHKFVSSELVDKIRIQEFSYNHLDEHGVLTKNAPATLMGLERDAGASLTPAGGPTPSHAK